MTTEDHNRTLGILHLAYGGLHALLLAIVAGFLIPIMLITPPSGRPGDAAGGLFMAMIMVIMGFFWLLFSVPSFIAGWGLLKKKKWAKVWSMIAGGVAGMSFPMGTALCVYTFWFLFSAGGKEMYDSVRSTWEAGRQGFLHGAPEPANWQARNREREYEHAYRSGPPDWRGE